MPNRVAFSVIFVVALGSPGLAQTYADLVFRNANIVTMDDLRPSASALAIAGELFVAVGTFDEVEPWIDEGTAVHDLGGRTIIPGINETHIHVRDLGFQQRYAVNLEDALSIADVQRMLRERLETLRAENRLGGWRYPTTGETGEWLFGLGWTQDRLEEKRMANRHELDQVSRDVPISLWRWSRVGGRSRATPRRRCSPRSSKTLRVR